MRICDAGKRASADLSPAICGLAAVTLVQIKYLLKGNLTMSLSFLLYISRTWNRLSFRGYGL